jgi:RNA polymerase sigma-70 factor (ECF subfamily)
MLPQATSAALAARLLGRASSPSAVAMRAELKNRLLEALDNMDPMDREVLTLRHFEQLTTAETAKELRITEMAAKKRHIRALARLKEIMTSTGDGPGASGL